MTQRQFNTAYKRAIEKKELEREKRMQQRLHRIAIETAKEKRDSRWDINNMTMEDVFKIMELKASMGIFQSFDPKDFGADYDIVPVPRDGTDEAEFWFGKRHPETSL